MPSKWLLAVFAPLNALVILVNDGVPYIALTWQGLSVE
jgi:hypothetical protein